MRRNGLSRIHSSTEVCEGESTYRVCHSDGDLKKWYDGPIAYWHLGNDFQQVMEEQLLTQSLQQFDSTFFAMLRELNNLLLDLEKSAQGNESKLTKCHDAVINEFSHSIQTQIIGYFIISTPSIITKGCFV